MGTVAPLNEIGIGLPGRRRTRDRFFVIFRKRSTDRSRTGFFLIKGIEQLVVGVDAVVKRNRPSLRRTPEHIRSIVQTNVWSETLVSYGPETVPIAKQRFGTGKDEVYRGCLVAQQQHEDVIVSDAILHPQEGGTAIMDLRIVDFHKTPIWQDVIRA
jgi:hypothetical protein